MCKHPLCGRREKEIQRYANPFLHPPPPVAPAPEGGRRRPGEPPALEGGRRFFASSPSPLSRPSREGHATSSRTVGQGSYLCAKEDAASLPPPLLRRCATPRRVAPPRRRRRRPNPGLCFSVQVPPRSCSTPSRSAAGRPLICTVVGSTPRSSDDSGFLLCPGPPLVGFGGRGCRRRRQEGD
jgi:hypothetical protein